MINKDLVKNSFKKTLKTYDENALVQKKMARKLIEMLPSDKYSKVLEIGSGTGFFTKLLAENVRYSEFLANDIVPESSQYVSRIMDGAVFVSGDIEYVDLPKDVDLIASNAALQWVVNLQDTFGKIHSSLKKDGIFLFSTFGAKNFQELRDVANIGLEYLTLQELKGLLEKYFEVKSFIHEEEKVCFSCFKDILRHIKLTGVNGLSNHPLSFSEIKRIEKQYREKYTQEGMYCLTYNPLYILLKKKS